MVTKSPELYESELLQPRVRVIASIGSPLALADELTLRDLAHCKWIVYRANMPMRILLEREFYDAGIRFPTNLLETTSPFATLALLRRNSSLRRAGFDRRRVLFRPQRPGQHSSFSSSPCAANRTNWCAAVAH